MPIIGQIKPYDAKNYDPNFIDEYGGYEPEQGWRGNNPTPGQGSGGGGRPGGGGGGK